MQRLLPLYSRKMDSCWPVALLRCEAVRKLKSNTPAREVRWFCVRLLTPQRDRSDTLSGAFRDKRDSRMLESSHSRCAKDRMIAGSSCLTWITATPADK